MSAQLPLERHVLYMRRVSFVWRWSEIDVLSREQHLLDVHRHLRIHDSAYVEWNQETAFEHSTIQQTWMVLVQPCVDDAQRQLVLEIA